MTARQDFPALASFACQRGVTRDSAELQAAWALNRIDELEAQLAAAEAQLARQAPIIQAATHAVEMDGEPDVSDCPYFARYTGLEGHDPEAVCGYACVDEPECVTCEPSGGWPRLRLRAAVAGLSLREPTP